MASPIEISNDEVITRLAKECMLMKLELQDRMKREDDLVAIIRQEREQASEKMAEMKIKVDNLELELAKPRRKVKSG